MTSLLAPTPRRTFQRRTIALLCCLAVVGVPVVHALTEVVGAGRGIEAEHSGSCQALHAAELCAAAAGVLIARTADGPAARALPPGASDRHPTAPAAPPSAPLILTAAARAPPAS